MSPTAYPMLQETCVSPSDTEKTLLWVDDYEPALALYKTLFGLSGFHVLTASSGKRALEVLKSNHVDAVITDYDMPSMDGAVLAHSVKQLRPALPVIMFSGSPEVADQVSHLVDAFCDKGESRNKLLAVINQFVWQEDKENPASLVAASATWEEAASHMAS